MALPASHMRMRKGAKQDPVLRSFNSPDPSGFQTRTKGVPSQERQLVYAALDILCLEGPMETERRKYDLPDVGQIVWLPCVVRKNGNTADRSAFHLQF